MSLPPELWAALRLDPEVIRARAEYFAAYAESEAPLFQPDSIIRALRDGPVASGEHAVVSLFHEHDGPVRELRQRIADGGEGSRHASWVRVAERADALRQSAIAELLLDTRSGAGRLLRSADHYRRLGLPFGAFLRTVVTGSGHEAFEAGRQLMFVLGPDAPLESGEGAMISLERALSAPAQQVAALLTATSLPDAIYEFRLSAERLADAAQFRSSAPVGTTGQPMALWWQCGAHLGDLAFGRGEARDGLRRLIAEVAAAHGIQLRNAQYDGFHWPAAAGRVDLVDMDLAGLVAISARLLNQLDGPYWDILDDFGSLSPLSLISIQIGLDLAEQEGEDAVGTDPGARPQPGPAFDARPESGQSGTVLF